MKVYVASSWRNEHQPEVVAAIRAAGHEVYDFRNPSGRDHGFHWSEIDPNWKSWTADEFVTGLNHQLAENGFLKDMGALFECNACVLIMPCGRSAHLELGWAVGAGKETAILLSDGESELMYQMVDLLASDVSQVVEWLDDNEAFNRDCASSLAAAEEIGAKIHTSEP